MEEDSKPDTPKKSTGAKYLIIGIIAIVAIILLARGGGGNNEEIIAELQALQTINEELESKFDDIEGSILLEGLA